MTKMIEISDRLAADDDLGLETETLQTLVDESEASGPTQPWNAVDEFAEIRARYVADTTP